MHTRTIALVAAALVAVPAATASGSSDPYGPRQRVDPVGMRPRVDPVGMRPRVDPYGSRHRVNIRLARHYR